MENEIKINVPEGYEIDKENSTFECIKFKPIAKRWRDNEENRIKGFYISDTSNIREFDDNNIPSNYNLFATKKQAKSALAMARISQIMDNNERFGGIITDEEWKNDNTPKYTIIRESKCIVKTMYRYTYAFLAFHTPDQRDLFLEENEDLIKNYLMIE